MRGINSLQEEKRGEAGSSRANTNRAGKSEAKQGKHGQGGKVGFKIQLQAPLCAHITPQLPH